MKNKAIFLDRDGVIIEDIHYIKSIKEVKIYNFSRKAIEILKDLGYLVIVISNQSAIAREMTTINEVNKINMHLKQVLKFDDIFFCPHIEKEKANKINQYTKQCECRKPKTLLGKIAINKYNIDVNKSFMVGDRDTDILFGKNLGLKTVLLYNNTNKYEIKSDYKFNNLIQFSNYLKEVKI